MQRVQAVGWTVTEDGCWSWDGERLPNGRARIRAYVGGKMRRAYPYRVLFEAQHGPIPEGLVACHTCERPWCVNPAHIVPGTQRRNLAMIRPGTRQHEQDAAELELRVIELRLEGLTHQAIADRLGLHRVTVTKIVNRKATGGRKAS